MQDQLANIYQTEGKILWWFNIHFFTCCWEYSNKRVGLAKGKQEAANINESDKVFLGLKENIKHYKAEALLVKLKELQKSQTNENIIFQIKAKGLEENEINKVVENLENRLTTLENSLQNSRKPPFLDRFFKLVKRISKFTWRSPKNKA